MTTTLVTLTGNVSDALGDEFDARRTKVYVRYNTDRVVTDDDIRLGGATVSPDSTGAFTLTDVVASTSLVENLQVTVVIDYADPSTRQRAQESLGPYDLSAETGTVDIHDLEEVQALDPTWVTAKTLEIQGYLDDAADLLAQQEAISGLTGEDDAVALLVNTPDSDTAVALSATFARVFTPEKYGAVGDGSTDDGAAFLAAFAAITAAGGGTLWCSKPSYYFATDLELDADHVRIAAQPDRGTQFLFAPAAQFRAKPGATPHDYQVQRLILEDIMFYPDTSAARSKPTVQLNDVIYLTARNCTFVGDNPRTQAALKMQATLYALFEKCDFWGGSVGIQGGDTDTNSPNDVLLLGCNFNGSAKATAGNFFALNIRGGSCQSVDDGFIISGNALISSSTINIEGVYFEAVTGRCVSAGTNGYVYNLRVVGNYMAALTATTTAPIYVKKVVGYTVENNHWAGYNASVTGLVEVDVATAGGLWFPRKGRIDKNVNPYTDERAQYFFTSGMAADDKSQLAGANEGFGTGRKKVRTRPMTISAAGTVNAIVFDDAKNRLIHSVKRICEDTFDGTANLTVGVGAAIGFHVNTTALTSHAASTITTLTLSNSQTRPANGVVFARIVTTAVTMPGTFVLEIEYSEAD